MEMITKHTLMGCLGILADNYAKETTELTINAWNEIFKDFDERLFKKTCEKILKTSSYFPKVNEFIAMYKQIQKSEEQERYEKLKASQRLLVQGQSDCYLCDNTGFCICERNNYEFMARCICGHGKDLNKFSKAQIDKDYIPEIKTSHTPSEVAKMKEGKNPFYLLTIKESLGADFVIYEAQKKAQKLDKPDLSDSDKLKILHTFSNCN